MVYTTAPKMTAGGVRVCVGWSVLCVGCVEGCVGSEGFEGLKGIEMLGCVGCVYGDRDVTGYVGCVGSVE